MLVGGASVPLRLRSVVGIIPLFAVEFIEEGRLDKLPGFAKRTRWFLENRKDLASHISYMARDGQDPGRRILAIPTREPTGAGAPVRPRRGGIPLPLRRPVACRAPTRTTPS